MKFETIIADPAWSFSDSLSMSKVKRGASANYKTMSVAEISALQVQKLANPDGCVLVLWVIGSLLQSGLDVMKAWNFEHKQVLVWVKTKKQKTVKGSLQPLTIDNCLSFGMGRLFRQTHEIALVGINNTKIYSKLRDKSQRSVIMAPNLGHSTKPEFAQDSLERMFSDDTINRLELFARRQRPGWYCLGNSAPMTLKEDLNDSIDKLINLASSDQIILEEYIKNYTPSVKDSLYEFWAGL